MRGSEVATIEIQQHHSLFDDAARAKEHNDGACERHLCELLCLFTD